MINRHASMNSRHSENMQRGLVISDLHLFADRSRGWEYLELLRLDSVEVLVLNGDIVDFRWSILRDIDKTKEAGLDWLNALLRRWPRCDIHFVFEL